MIAVRFFIMAVFIGALLELAKFNVGLAVVLLGIICCLPVLGGWYGTFE